MVEKVGMSLKEIFLMLFLCLSIVSYSQIKDVEWNTKTIPLEKQKQYFENGNLELENVLINDTLFRIQYYESGDIKLKAQIIQEIYDTIWELNPVTYLEKMKIVDYLKDIKDGLFIAYFKNGNIKNPKLDETCIFYEIDFDDVKYHSATYDVSKTYEILKKMNIV